MYTHTHTHTYTHTHTHTHARTHARTHAQIHILLREYFIVYKYNGLHNVASSKKFDIIFLVKLNFINPLPYFSLTN